MDELVDEGYADPEPRCDNCGSHDISIRGPRGSFCGWECREAIRQADNEEAARVNANLRATAK